MHFFLMLLPLLPLPLLSSSVLSLLRPHDLMALFLLLLLPHLLLFLRLAPPSSSVLLLRRRRVCLSSEVIRPARRRVGRRDLERSRWMDGWMDFSRYTNRSLEYELFSLFLQSRSFSLCIILGCASWSSSQKCFFYVIWTFE